VLEDCGNVTSVCLSHDGSLAAVSTVRPAELQLWQLPSGGEEVSDASAEYPAPCLLRHFTGFRAHRYVVRSCFAGPADSVLLSGSEDGLVYAYATREGAEEEDASADSPAADADPAQLGCLRGHTATVNSLAATVFNGVHLFASASDDHTIHLWRMRTTLGHGASAALSPAVSSKAVS